jgi:type II secretory pathway pseudopilin PulG
MRGYTLADLIVALALAATCAALAVPRAQTMIEHWRARSAASFVAARVALARADALHRNTNVGLRFEREDDEIGMRLYADANGDGVRNADIDAGIDPPLAPLDRVDRLFPGVTFGFAPGVSLIDGTPAAEGADPIRVGTTRVIVLTPLGASSGGTLYLHGRGGWEYAVVVLGATGRTRTLEWDATHGAWSDPW